MWRADSDGSPVTLVGNFRTFPPTYVLGWGALPIPVEAALLAVDGERSPSLSRPPCWQRMGSAPHPCQGRPTGGGWGALPIAVEAALLEEDGERSPSLWRPPSWQRMGSAPCGCRTNPFPLIFDTHTTSLFGLTGSVYTYKC
jgi:hypothetical protein